MASLVSLCWLVALTFNGELLRSAVDNPSGRGLLETHQQEAYYSELSQTSSIYETDEDDEGVDLRAVADIVSLILFVSVHLFYSFLVSDGGGMVKS